MSTRTPKDFNMLEDKLAATLKPVPPGQAFVRTVRQRMTLAAPVVAIRPAPDMNPWLVTLAEVVSVFVVAAIIARLVRMLLDRPK